MKPQAETAHPLPAQRAFLVQVHAEAEVAQGRLAGRVEHVVSGQATHFASLEELLAFLALVLPPRERTLDGTLSASTCCRARLTTSEGNPGRDSTRA
jgi:hypothetical protein